MIDIYTDLQVATGITGINKPDVMSGHATSTLCGIELCLHVAAHHTRPGTHWACCVRAGGWCEHKDPASSVTAGCEHSCSMAARHGDSRLKEKLGGQSE